MPEAVAVWAAEAAFAAAAAGASAAVIGTIAAISFWSIVGYGLLLVGANAMQQRAKRKARDKYNASQVDRLQSVSSTAGPRELVLGKVRKGGTVVFRDSCGTYNEKFVMVIALASHKINGIEKYYLNEKEVTLDSNGYVQEAPYRIRSTTRSVTSEVVPGSCYDVTDENGYVQYQVCQYYTYNSVARIRIVDGSQTTADTRLQQLFPNVWTANHILKGVAYAIIELDYNESAFPSGIPTFTALIKGAEVYDPRTGSTAFSENPALHARHIITHPRFGKRTSLTAREDARIIAAANACDTVYTPAGGSATQLYKAGAVFPFGGQAADALDDLCQGMCGMWAYAGGEFFIKAGVYTAPVKTLNASDLMTLQKDSTGGSTSKAVTINTHKARADKLNSVTAKIYDAGAEYKETTIAPVKNAAAIAKDGVELPLEIALPTVASASQAQVVCNYMLKDSFDPLALVAHFKMTAYELELFDNVALNLPRFGWSNKVFTVLGRNFSPTGSIELTLRETSAELFNPLVFSNSMGFASNTGLREPWDIDHPGVLTMSSGTAELLVQGDGSLVTRVRVQWAEILDERIRQGGYVELRWKDVSSSTWSTVTVPGVESSAYLLGAVDGSTIVVMARTRTQLAVSDWNVQKTHLVLGKSEPPSDVTGLRIEGSLLSWSAVTDTDLAGYEIRYHYGTANTDWGTAIKEHAGLITSTPYLLQSKPSTVVTFMVKAVDRSGNYSSRPAYLITSLGDKLVSNVVESYDYKLLNYPGEIFNGYREFGSVKSEQSDYFYKEDASDFYTLAGALFYSQNFDAMTWTSTPITPTKAAAGSNMFIDFTESSSGYAVEYRLTGPNPFYKEDLTYFYTPDEELFFDGLFFRADADLFYLGDAELFYDGYKKPFYDEPPEFIPWPGVVSAVNQEYQFRYRSLSGSVPGNLSEFKVYIDVPDKVMYFPDLVVSASGTRLPVAGQFSVIQNIQMTLQDTTAVTAYAVDKSVLLGPLVYTSNAQGVAVSSVVDVTVQGY